METVIYGTGPLACETHRILKDQSVLDIIGFISDKPAQSVDELCGLRILGRLEDLSMLRTFGVEGICIATFDGEERILISKLSRKLGLEIVSAISASARVEPDARLGKGCIIQGNARVEAGSVLGDCCYLGSGVTVKNSAVIPPGSNIKSGSIVTMEKLMNEDTTELETATRMERI